MNRRLVGFGVAMLLVAILNACGGSGSGSVADAAPSLSMASFIRKGDAICEQLSSRRVAALERYSKEHHLSEVKSLSRAQQEEVVRHAVLPPFKRQGAELEALNASKAYAAAIEHMMKVFNLEITKLEKDPGMALGESDPFVAFGSKAAKFGFKVCGQ
jgi:hypothetical protein